MKKSITLAAIFAASAAYAGTFQTWNGEDGISQVQTGLDNGSETSGYWFSYADNEDGGKSKVNWPVDTSTDTGESLDAVITHCKGVCGVASLSKSTLKYSPFVGIGFNVVGEAVGGGDPEPGDASAWEGICITYTCDISADLELGLGSFDSEIEYANPVAKLSKAKDIPTTQAIPWSKFAQPSWYTGSVKISGTEAAKRLVAVKFKIQANDGNYNFNIKKIGPLTDCSDDSKAIKATRSTSSAKATLTGRTLSFTGVKTAATAEIINSQGQVVLRGTIDITTSSLNLATLDAGAYMIRVTGKNVNFAKEIMLK